MSHEPPSTRPPLGFLAALDEIEAYADAGNLHRLRLVLESPDLRLAAGLGRASARAFLSLCELAGERRCALVWLGPAAPGRTRVAGTDAALGPALWRRARTLVVDPEVRR